MPRTENHIGKTLSFRLSLLVIGALAILLVGALCIMFIFSRKVLKEEAISDAAQTLEATVNRIDNLLLDVEQSTGNIYFKMANYIHQPEKMATYAQRLVDDNPYITDAHFHWLTDSVTVDINTVGWTTPQQQYCDANEDAVTIFRLPIYDGQTVVGAFDVTVSLTQLSKIVLETKPSPHSFCVLLGKDGKFIVSPDSTYLNESAFEVARDRHGNAEESVVKAMTSGETGYQYIRVQGKDYYMFYKPFVRADVQGRAQIDLGWSCAIAYPEDDIFHDYNRLLHFVLIIAVVGLLLLLISCRSFIHHQLVLLRQLEQSAQHIANGFYNVPIPDTRRKDEIGRLQNYFHQMQQSLSTRVGEMQRASDLLQERREVLEAAYEQAQAGDRMKTNFLYNMSDQMTAPVTIINNCVTIISEHADKLSDEETNSMVDEIQQQGGRITALLNQLISESEKIKN